MGRINEATLAWKNLAANRIEKVLRLLTVGCVLQNELHN